MTSFGRPGLGALNTGSRLAIVFGASRVPKATALGVLVYGASGMMVFADSEAVIDGASTMMAVGVSLGVADE